MQNRKHTSFAERLTLKGISAIRRQFYFYTLLALVAVLGNRLAKSDTESEIAGDKSNQSSHMANVASNTQFAYR